MSDDPWTPPDEWKLVKAGRFLNLLDDAKNILSPTKINLWAANLGAISAMAVAIFAWVGNHMSGIETVMGGAIGWLTQASVFHHNDKKERNLQKARMEGKHK